MEVPKSKEELTDEEIIDLFGDRQVNVNGVAIANVLSPEGEGGIILNKQQRQEKGLDKGIEQGFLIVGVGQRAEEAGMKVGDRAWKNAHAQGFYNRFDLADGDVTVVILDYSYISHWIPGNR